MQSFQSGISKHNLFVKTAQGSEGHKTCHDKSQEIDSPMIQALGMELDRTLGLSD